MPRGEQSYMVTILAALLILLASACSPSPKTESMSPSLHDSDGDGIADESDPCPRMFDPDGRPTACGPWLGAGWRWQQELVLPDAALGGGGDPSVDTGTPFGTVAVHVPLSAGYLNSDVAGYWTFDDHDLSLGTFGGTSVANIVTAGARIGAKDGRGHPYGARWLDGDTRLLLPPLAQQFSAPWWPEPVRATATPSAWTLCMRYRQDFSALSGNRLLLSDLDPPSGRGASEAPPASPAALYVAMALRDGRLRCTFSGASGVIHQDATGVAHGGAWHSACLVVRRPAAQGAGSVSCWQDGALVGETALTTGGDPASNHPLTVGGSISPMKGGGFIGAIDDLLVLRRALDSIAVRAWARALQPFGRRLSRHGQADFDDLRVTRRSNSRRLGGVERRIRVPSALTGARPHSDTELTALHAWWSLDGTCEERVAGRDASCEGTAATLGRFGEPLGAMRFDGGGRVALPNLVPRGTSSFTIEFWLRLDLTVNGEAGEASQWLVSERREEISAPLELVFDRTAERLSFRPGVAGTLLSAHVPGLGEAGRWRHIGATFSAGAMALYVDGVQVAADTTSATKPALSSKSAWMGGAIGQRWGTKEGYLLGAIDELRVHKVARTAAWFRAQVGVPTLHTQTVRRAGPNGRLHPLRLHWGYPHAEVLAGGQRLHPALVEERRPGRSVTHLAPYPQRAALLLRQASLADLGHWPARWRVYAIRDNTLTALARPRWLDRLLGDGWHATSLALSSDGKFVAIRESTHKPGIDPDTQDKRLRIFAAQSALLLTSEPLNSTGSGRRELSWDIDGSLFFLRGPSDLYARRCRNEWYRARPGGSVSEGFKMSPFIVAPAFGQVSIGRLDRRPGHRTFVASVGSDCNGNSYDIALFSEDGIGTKKLTSSDIQQSNPLWAADGLSLYWTAGDSISGDGTKTLQRAGVDGEDQVTVWSPPPGVAITLVARWPDDGRLFYTLTGKRQAFGLWDPGGQGGLSLLNEIAEVGHVWP